MDFQQWLTAKGINPATLDEATKTALQAAWRAEQVPIAAPVKAADPPAPTPAPTPAPAPARSSSMEDKLRAIEEETDRRLYIEEAMTALAQKHVGNAEKLKQIRELGQAAIADDKMDRRAIELAMLRLDRMGGPHCYTTSSPQVTAEVVEAAICKAGGLAGRETLFSPQVLETADKRFKRGIGLQQLVGLCARSNGWRGDDVKGSMKEAMRAAFGFGGMQASVSLPSTISVSDILSSTANKFLNQAFLSVESSWQPLAATRNVSDFKQITAYALTGDLSYKKLAPGGDIKHGTLGSESWTNQADTYALILAIDRRDMINDDLGAFTGINRRLGRGGAITLNEVFWTEFLADHSTFFPTDNSKKNYDAGADSAFSNDGLVNADLIWSTKTDADGKPLGAKARFLLVPSAHRIAALRLMNSQSFGTTGEEGEQNPWAGQFEVVSSVYLSNSAMGGGYSALAWYLIADPADIPVIEVAFLNGARMPTVEEVEMSADHLGMAMRAYWDFGVAKQDYRGGLKMKGEA